MTSPCRTLRRIDNVLLPEVAPDWREYNSISKRIIGSLIFFARTASEIQARDIRSLGDGFDFSPVQNVLLAGHGAFTIGNQGHALLH